jgi:hypothetical protein
MHFNFKIPISISVFFLSAAFAWPATFHTISSSRAPITSCKLCIGHGDSCFFTDSSGIVAVRIPDSSADSISLSASGYFDTSLFASANNLGEDPVEVVLKEKSSVYELPNMVVSTSVNGDKNIAALSSTKFTSFDIKTAAGTADDISRYIGTLPSVVSGISEGYDNTFYVRGGRPSETVFLVDGIEMENINHFSTADGSGGPIGFINADFIDSVRFFAENIPASYPARISSVVDISMKEGPDHIQQEAGIELTGGIYSIQGPLPGNGNSFVLSGRYVDFSPMRTVIVGKGTPKLGDVYGKFGLLKTDNLELSTTGIFSFNWYRYAYPITLMSNELQPQAYSNIDNQIQRIFQGGTGLSLRYSSGSSVHEAHASVSFRNGSDFDSLGSFTDPFFIQSYAKNPITRETDDRIRYTLSTKSTSQVTEGSALSYGVHAQAITYDFASANEAQNSGTCVICDSLNRAQTIAWKLNATEKSAHLDDQELGAFASFEMSYKQFKGTLGLRADYFKMLDNLAFSPRISAAYDIRHGGTITGGFGLYHQFPSDMPSLTYQYLANSGLTSDSVEAVETRLLRRMQPLRCWETSIGYDKMLLKGVDAKCGLYYKWYDREYPYSTPFAQDLWYVDSTGKVVLPPQNSDRKAYGFELSLQNNHSRLLFYSLGGALFSIKDKFSDGSWHDDWVNVGYTFSAAGGLHFLSNHEFSLSVQGTGGRPYSPEIITANCIGIKSAQYAPGHAFNSERLDKILTANVRYCYSTHLGTWNVEAFIEILNLFNNLPTIDYTFDGENMQPVKPFGITPVVGCKVQF